jgi:hypothetical protein
MSKTKAKFKRSLERAEARLAAATLTAISPTSGNIGIEITLTATGTGFVDGDVLNYGIEALATTFVDAGTLTGVVTPIDDGPHDVFVTCADGDTNAVVFEAIGSMPPAGDTTAAECLAALKTGDTSLLASTSAEELSGVRGPFKDWMRDEIARVETLWANTYNAVLHEMNVKGVPY